MHIAVGSRFRRVTAEGPQGHMLRELCGPREHRAGCLLVHVPRGAETVLVPDKLTGDGVDRLSILSMLSPQALLPLLKPSQYLLTARCALALTDRDVGRLALTSSSLAICITSLGRQLYTSSPGTASSLTQG